MNPQLGWAGWGRCFIARIDRLAGPIVRPTTTRTRPKGRLGEVDSGLPLAGNPINVGVPAGDEAVAHVESNRTRKVTKAGATGVKSAIVTPQVEIPAVARRDSKLRPQA